MIMESVMDFSSTNSSSNASSPRGSPPTMKPPASPPSTPPRDATPTNNNNNISNNNNTKEAIERASPQRVPASPMESPMQHPLLQGPPHGPHGPHGPPHPMPPPHHMSQMRHLGPPGLGLFNSLMGSPLEFMAAAQAQAQAHQQQHPQQHPPRAYNSPPPISSSDPTANECKLVTYRGQKVAAFMISGETMLCLPQAFELFLKHLVGGLHTVYTKLKRLDIVPLVCNVEQVRILRGLGAIQPGVNRCKLLSCKDFDTLYRDCTTARCLMSQRTPTDSRPGRPPKRVPMGLGSLLPASLQGHPQLKKHRLENGDFVPFENGHLSGSDKSPLLANGYNAPPSHLQAMQQLYQHPLLSPSLPPLPPLPPGGQGPHPAAGGPGGAHPQPHLHPALRRPDMKQPGAQGGLPGMEAIANWENCRAAYEDIVKHLERMQQERGEAEGIDSRPRDLSSHNGSPNGHSPVLNLSKGGGGGCGGSAGASDHSDSDPGASDKEDDDDDMISNPDEDEDLPRATDLMDSQIGRGSSSSPLHASPPPPYGAGNNLSARRGGGLRGAGGAGGAGGVLRGDDGAAAEHPATPEGGRRERPRSGATSGYGESGAQDGRPAGAGGEGQSAETTHGRDANPHAVAEATPEGAEGPEETPGAAGAGDEEAGAAGGRAPGGGRKRCPRKRVGAGQETQNGRSAPANRKPSAKYPVTSTTSPSTTASRTKPFTTSTSPHSTTAAATTATAATAAAATTTTSAATSTASAESAKSAKSAESAAASAAASSATESASEAPTNLPSAGTRTPITYARFSVSLLQEFRALRWSILVNIFYLKSKKSYVRFVTVKIIYTTLV